MMRGTITLGVVGALTALAADPAQSASAPRIGGTIAVTAPPGIGHDISTEAATAALGMRGFTILNDAGHAAYVAEVVTTRTEVGTSVEKKPSARALGTGGGVSVPLSRGKSVLVSMQRTEMEITIRARRAARPLAWRRRDREVRRSAER